MTIKRWRCMHCEIDFEQKWNCKCGDDGPVVEVYISLVSDARLGWLDDDESGSWSVYSEPDTNVACYVIPEP